MYKLIFLLIIGFQISCDAKSDDWFIIRGNGWHVDTDGKLYLGQWRTGSVFPVTVPGKYTNVVANGDTKKKIISLTFDDAPDDEQNMKHLLDILDAHHAKGAFFTIGKNINEQNAQILKRADKEGHLIVSHSFSHPRMTDLNASMIDTEIKRNAKLIESVIGKYPLLFRPPYGATNPLVANSLKNNGMEVVLWSMDSLDWALKDPDEIVRIVTQNVQNGDIILMHCHSSTVASLATIIEKLQKSGFEFVGLDDMLSMKAYR